MTLISCFVFGHSFVIRASSFVILDPFVFSTDGLRRLWMHACVRVLLNRILDYAGLFPPAKLPLEDALRTYLRYRKESPHRWMLGRFVCPTARLPDLLTL